METDIITPKPNNHEPSYSEARALKIRIDMKIRTPKTKKPKKTL